MNVWLRSGKYTFLLLVFLVFQAAGTPSFAAGVGWDQLSAQEKKVLGHLKQHWGKYPAFKQIKMQRWARQSPAQRTLIKTRFKRWSSLSGAQKSKIKIQLKRFKSMPPEKRMKLKAWWRWVSRLPKHEQDKLKRKLPGMSQTQKREYIRQLEEKYGRR
ncbi:MAG: DUF3106 domain-containing protein [Thiolinea sp.]